ncbi:MAG TPA: hypothetical protein DCE41_06410 [Cytophagales bacterium]|nr:hypothetical protein [Cytophagales bacterium]HAA18274.1 hypothetical protein [Cytophagales bacterium]HAP63178.1 hypothetical protein [Cytophagales bacterium]
MDPIDLATLVAFHQSHQEKPTSAGKAGWSSEEAQQLRFTILERLGDWEDASILDVGCGLGDFWKFISARYQPTIYKGVDILPNFISQAQELNKDEERVTFSCGDYMQQDLLAMDYVVACGALSYPTSVPDHPYSAIGRLWSLCNKGLGFNLLKTQKTDRERYLRTYHPEEVMEFCQGISPKTEMIDSYSPDDFTVLMHR